MQRMHLWYSQLGKSTRQKVPYCHEEEAVIRKLTTDLSFINSGNERDQCFHACHLLRMERMPALPYSLIGHILGIDKGLVRRPFKWAIAHPNGPSPNGRPLIRSQEQRNQLIEAISQAHPECITGTWHSRSDGTPLFFKRHTNHSRFGEAT
jgi:hypothetical protein